jgi:hypothetical protein
MWMLLFFGKCLKRKDVFNTMLVRFQYYAGILLGGSILFWPTSRRSAEAMLMNVYLMIAVISVPAQTWHRSATGWVQRKWTWCPERYFLFSKSSICRWTVGNWRFSNGNCKWPCATGLFPKLPGSI